MGLTHYWQRPIELPKSEFAEAAKDIATVFGVLGIPLGDEEGLREPVLTDESICFNGTRGHDCEPFIIHRYQESRRGSGIVSGYCKTEGHEYDICVKCSLVILKHHLGEALHVSSDAKIDDWERALSVCREHFGTPPKFSLDD